MMMIASLSCLLLNFFVHDFEWRPPFEFDRVINESLHFVTLTHWLNFLLALPLLCCVYKKSSNLEKYLCEEITRSDDVCKWNELKRFRKSKLIDVLRCCEGDYELFFNILFFNDCFSTPQANLQILFWPQFAFPFITTHIHNFFNFLAAHFPRTICFIFH